MDKAKKIRFPCPCGGKIRWAREKVFQEGVDCGILDVEICDKCGTMYLPDWSMMKVEEKLKEQGLWGIKRRDIRFWKSGGSVIMRLPTEMAQEFGLDSIKRGQVYKDGERKFVVEF